MARVRSPNRDKAKKLYIESNGTMKLTDIAAELNLSDSQIRKWKSQDKWDQELKVTLPKNKGNVTFKRGGQPNNKNAIGNNGGAPKENKNAETHGFFSKFLPKDTLNIINEMDEDPSKILWQNIQIQYAAIVRAQNIMLVESKDDITKELSGETNGDTSSSERYTIQFAWDKQASFLKAQSRAMAELRLLIKQFESTANDEQKTKIAKMKAELNKINGSDDENIEDDGFIEALNGRASEVWNNE